MTEYKSNPSWDSQNMERISVSYQLPLTLIEQWYNRIVRFDPQIYMETELADLNPEQQIMLANYFIEQKFSDNPDWEEIAKNCSIQVEQVKEYFFRALNELKLQNWNRRGQNYSDWINSFLEMHFNENPTWSIQKIEFLIQKTGLLSKMIRDWHKRR